MLIVADGPQTLLLSYENLAAEISVAEAQKDVLSQFLRTQFSGVSAIIENNGTQDGGLSDFARGKVPQARTKRIVLRCLQCGRSQQEFSLEASTIRIDGQGGDYKFQASFKVATTRGISETWRVSVMPDESGFCVLAKTTIPPSRIVAMSDFAVESCKKDGRSNRAAIFESPQQALLQLENVKGFRLAQHVNAGSFLSEEILSQPIAVKAYEQVKVVLDGETDFQIKTVGRVLQSASKGQTVKVELEKMFGSQRYSAKRTIDAVVVAPGEVAYVR